MTKDQLYSQILEFLRISISTYNDELVRSLARTLTKFCTENAIVDPDEDDIISILNSIADSITTVAMNISQEIEE